MDEQLRKMVENVHEYADWLRDHKTADDDLGFYLTGRRNARNLYQRGVDHDSNIHIGVMFEPEMAKLVVIALNEYHENHKL